MTSSNELRQFGLIPAAGVLAGFLIAVLVSVFVVQGGANSRHREALANASADRLKELFDLELAAVQRQLAKMGTSIHLAEITSANDRDEIVSQETILTTLIPGAVRIRIFRTGEARVDRDAIPPFSFTSLDLVNKTETGNVANPEAIRVNGRWLLSIATPIRIPTEEKIRGTLFTYLEMQQFADMLASHASGHVRIDQTVGSARATEILSLGTPPGEGIKPVQRNLQNPNWTLTYYPSAGDNDIRVTGFTASILPAVVFLILALAGIYVGLTRMTRMLVADLSHLDHQIASVASGRFEPSSSDYHIGLFAEVDQSLSRLGVRQEEPAAVPKLDIKAVKPEEPVEDLVDIELLDDETFEEAVEKLGSGEKNQETEPSVDYSGVFRAYDIRGIVDDTLTPALIRSIGLAIGSEAEARGQESLVVGCDGRTSSPAVMEMLIEGILASGRDVISIGAVPTPVLYYATHNSETESGVMVTASHNPPEYNGFKVVLAGHTLVEDEIHALHERIIAEDYTHGEGNLTEIDIRNDYIDAVADDVVVAQPLKVVVDCGNGIAGEIAPELLTALGCDVIPLYCEVDGTFPNHPPDPTDPDNLADLVLTVKSEDADLGIAIDGDGDRLVAVTADGEIIWPDRLLMLFTRDVISRNPGSDVVYDVKCTRHLNSIISGYGGRPVICRSGHSFIKEKMAETDAILGGEMSGHICFSERWFGFDDGLYSAARLIEIVGTQMDGLAELLEEFPVSIATPEIHIQVGEENKFAIMDSLLRSGDFGDGTLTKIDGIRVDYADGWGLVRASNTGPVLTLRFEADDSAALARIEEVFRQQLQAVDSSLDFAL